MDVELSERQITLIKNVAEEEGFHDYEFELLPSWVNERVDSLGVVVTVRIKNADKQLDLVLKVAHNNEELRTISPIRKAYLREINIYNTVFPAFETFLKENGVSNGFFVYPRIYGACSQIQGEFLLLEDLQEKGYKLWDKTVPMNSPHATLAFTEYAKFHAVSLAMRHKHPETYRKLSENFDNIWLEKLKSAELHTLTFKHILGKGFKAIENNDFATAALERIISDTDKSMYEYMKFRDHLVFIHGNVWRNRLMFQYKDPQNNEEPIKASLIDWQYSRTDSPVGDLSELLFTCCTKEIIYDYRKYLQIYHDTVTKHLKKLSCGSEELFPYSLLEHHFKKYSKFGLIAAIWKVEYMISVARETSRLSEFEEIEHHCSSIHIGDCYQRISDLIVFMAENDLI